MYIGSTFNELKYRWKGHKANYKNKTLNYSIYAYFDKYGIDNFTMKLLRSYNVYREHNKDNKHLRAYEQLWINKLKCVNKYCAFQPLKKERKKESSNIWENKNKEKKKEYIKGYYEKNKEKKKEYLKGYYENNKEKKKEYEQRPGVKEKRREQARLRYLKKKELFL